MNDIYHNFSVPSTPQQNRVVEPKNRTLEDMSQTMLINSGVLGNFWAEVVNNACYIVNRCLIKPMLNKTPYELFEDRHLSVVHLRIFECKCEVHNNGKNSLRIYNAHSDEAIFFGILFPNQVLQSLQLKNLVC